MITFEYDGKIYKPSNLEKKLKKLGITINDIKIIDDTDTKAETERKEKAEQHQNLEHMVSLYWDTKCKGWFQDESYNKEMPLWVNEYIKSGRYIYIGDYNVNELYEAKKTNFLKMNELTKNYQ